MTAPVKKKLIIAGQELDKSRLKTATLTLSYLKTNSSTHTSPFSALAELVDNAYDAHAKNLSIDFLEIGNQQMLQIIDDGDGMTPREMNAIYAFGHSKKTTKSDRVGRYGNGLKSGGFHLGRELLVLSKNGNTRTALLISHKFHEDCDERDTIFVPCVSYQLRAMDEWIPETMPDDEDLSWKRLLDDSKDKSSEEAAFEQDVEIINRYAPLCGQSLDYWFGKITGQSGTLLLIAGLQRTALGELSFSITEDDLILSKDEDMPWKSSIRSYLSILYLDPEMKIYLREKIVESKKVSGQWMFRRRTTFKGSDFKEAYLAEVSEKKALVENARQEFENEQSRLGEMNRSDMAVDRESRIAQNLLRKSVCVKKEAYDAQNEEYAGLANKRLNYTFNVQMGVNVMDRKANGIYFYINNRLIIPQFRDRPFFKKENTLGISMYISLDYTMFLPTHNKQGFASIKDFNALTRKCKEQFERYLNFLNVEGIPRHLAEKWGVAEAYDMDTDKVWDEFWKRMGYKNPRSVNCVQGSLTPELQKLLAVEPAYWRGCRNCQKWRKFNYPDIDPEFVCADIPHNTNGCELRKHIEKYEELRAPEPRPKPVAAAPRRVLPSPTIYTSQAPSQQITDQRMHERVKVESEDRNERGSGQLLQSVHSGPPDICLEEVANRSDVGEGPSNRIPRRRGSRSPPRGSATKRGGELVKSRTRYAEVDSEEEEEEERVPAKKARGKPGGKVPVKVMNREKWLEEKLNGFLLATGHEPLPKNGQKEFDPAIIIKARDKTQRLTLKTAQARQMHNEIVLGKMIKYMKTLPNCGIVVPENRSINSVISSIEKQLDERLGSEKASE